MRIHLAIAASVFLALFASGPVLAGDGPTGVSLRVVEIQAESLSLSTAFGKGTNTRQLFMDLGSGSNGKSNLGLEVTGGSHSINLEIFGGYVLIRDINNATNTTYNTSGSVSLAEGSYLVAGGPSASFRMTWIEEGNFGEGDMTIDALDGTNASVNYHPSGDTGGLWLATNGSSGSQISGTFTVFGSEDVERLLVWVNDVTGDGGFVMPAEASDQIPAVFPPGSHTITLGGHSLLSIVLDRDNDDDGGSGGSDDGLPGDLNGDCLVDGADLGLLLSQFGTNCP